jgi:hypothetical protein
MRNFSFRFILLVLIVLVSATGVFCQIYVSPSGVDNNPGTAATPVHTLERAVALARKAAHEGHEDVAILLTDGVYRLSSPLQLTAEDSSVSGHPLVFSATQGAHPVLSGAIQIRHWKEIDTAKNLWAAAIPSGTPDARQLYVNGIRATRTRGRLPVTLAMNSEGYTESTDTLSQWKQPTRIEFVYTGGNTNWSEKEASNGSWTEVRCPVASIAKTNIRMAEPCWKNSTERVMLPGNSRTANLVGPKSVGAMPSYMENAFEMLGVPGQFYLDTVASMLYYVPRPGEDLNRADVELPVLETLLEMRGTVERPIHDIAFNGIQFSYATWLGPNGPDGFSEIQAGYQVTGPDGYSKQALCTLVPGGACPYAAWTREQANVQVHYGHNIVFERDTFTHLGAAGLDLGEGAQQSMVEGCVFTDISGNGLQLASVDMPTASDEAFATGNRIENNLFENVGAEYRGGIGIVIGYARNTRVAHNQIDHIPYAAISIGWGGWPDKIKMAGQANRSTHNVIESNLIRNFMLVLSDGGGIYTQGRTGKDLSEGELIARNVIYNQFSTGHAIYTDNGSSMITVRQNVIFNTNFDNWGSRHQNWYDGRDGSTNDPLVIEGNYWQQGDEDSSEKDVVERENHLVNSLAQAPNEILQTAGLEQQFKDISARAAQQDAVPEPPSRVGAWAANGVAYVSWSPSVREGSSPVELYIVEASNGATATITAAEYSRVAYLKLSGLPAVPLTFTVKALNRQGASVDSMPSLPVVASERKLVLPAAPRNVSVHAGHGAVSIHFQSLDEKAWKGEASPLLAYEVTVEPEGRKVLFTGRRIVVLEGRHSTFDVVDGLKSGSVYTFKVAAVSAAGTGDPVTVGPVMVP